MCAVVLPARDWPCQWMSYGVAPQILQGSSHDAISALPSLVQVTSHGRVRVCDCTMCAGRRSRHRRISSWDQLEARRGLDPALSKELLISPASSGELSANRSKVCSCTDPEANQSNASAQITWTFYVSVPHVSAVPARTRADHATSKELLMSPACSGDFSANCSKVRFCTDPTANHSNTPTQST